MSPQSQQDDQSSQQQQQSKLKVAVIGGGIAGLSFAAHLSKTGTALPTVFDTGRLRPGGRCSSRLPSDLPKKLEPNQKQKQGGGKGGAKDDGTNKDSILQSCIVDHAAQLIKVSDKDGSPLFAKQVQLWEEQGIVTQLKPNSVGELTRSNHMIRSLNPSSSSSSKSDSFPTMSSTKFYYGTQGMGSIPRAIADADTGSFNIEQDVWVSPSNGVQYTGGKWRVKAKGQTLGEFDRLVIAHNGKCADRLMSKTPAKALHSLLQTNFAPTVPASGGKRMTLNSIYSLQFAVKQDTSPLTSTLSSSSSASASSAPIIPADMIALFIQNEPTLAFLSCNTRKYKQEGARESPYEVWTLLSSANFAKKHKGPQENLPQELMEDVTSKMTLALERALFGLTSDETTDSNNSNGSLLSSSILQSRLQLWGAAVPVNTWNYDNSNSTGNGDNKEGEREGGFVYDATHGVGVCGDWLLQPSIEGAWESGRRLAEWMAKELREDNGPNVNASRNSRYTKGLPSSSSSSSSTDRNSSSTKSSTSTGSPAGRFVRANNTNGIASFGSDNDSKSSSSSSSPPSTTTTPSNKKSNKKQTTAKGSANTKASTKLPYYR
jgi:predicted NAD/FAD-dependent oxidoreductase